MELRRILGDRLRLARLRAQLTPDEVARRNGRRSSLTQAELAARVGVSRITIARIEKAGSRVDISAGLLMEFAQSLKVSGWWLLGIRDRSDHAEFVTQKELLFLQKLRKLDEEAQDSLLVVMDTSDELLRRIRPVPVKTKKPECG